MESLAKGTHYNYANAREKKQRKAERKHGDTEGHCMTPGSWHV